MATLAIEGHATRGREVIGLLEMLGGKNIYKESGERNNEVYFISNINNICSDNPMALEGIISFTLEEFLEKFPYKVGDKAIYNGNVELINRMRWDGETIKYGFFTPKCIGEVTVEDLQPYKEEIMEERENNMEKINIAELLKDCPKGLELDCTIYNDVTFEGVINSSSLPIRIRIKDRDTIFLSKYGQFHDEPCCKCVIFPKGKTTWEGFVPPCNFKEGDVVINASNEYSNAFIYAGEGENDEFYSSYVGLCNGTNPVLSLNKSFKWVHKKSGIRFATEEEKKKLFDAIKANGYKWNAETKTLEKLVEPKFKVGSRIRLKRNPKYLYTIRQFFWIHENNEYGYQLLPDNDKHCIMIGLSKQDEYELAPNKFDITTLKPFESRVLVRDKDTETWEGQFYSRYNNNSDQPYICIGVEGLNKYKQCIPYEGNQELLGTTDDCDEYYKTWK